ncbi:IspD/TarI family cytidylyltransferase [Butyrivibrio sp. MC2013]|uniref:IspD/TarI family cytidylyltransferase n=1 Tax=Butyrivibrio sp. MC2013 TaxID=1280686 RepID=UPI00042022BD|nr:IspD/TarI family cytidylyltransferase [Butyrivibrio sp. MC2013]
MSVDRKCLCMILSGGTGSRITLEDRPKQYVEVGGRPIISYVLETAARNNRISGLVIVCAPEWEDFIREAVRTSCGGRFEDVSFARPGENRQLSILNGLYAMRDAMKDDDLVAILEAARPCLTDELLDECIAAAMDAEGSLPVLPMKDTIYMSSDGVKVSGLLDRSELFAGQAPEVFHYGKYLRANESLSHEEIMMIHGSTEPAIMAGMDIAMIPGDEANYKVTTNADLIRFRAEHGG